MRTTPSSSSSSCLSHFLNQSIYFYKYLQESKMFTSMILHQWFSIQKILISDFCFTNFACQKFSYKNNTISPLSFFFNSSIRTIEYKKKKIKIVKFQCHHLIHHILESKRYISYEYLLKIYFFKTAQIVNKVERHWRG